MTSTRRTRQILTAAGIVLALASPFARPTAASAGPAPRNDCTTRYSSTCDYTDDTAPDAKLVGTGWSCTTSRSGWLHCHPTYVFCLPSTNLCTET